MDICHRNRVVAHNLRVATKLAKVPGQVVHKAIVVVDEEDQVLYQVIENTGNPVKMPNCNLQYQQRAVDPAAG